MQVQEGRIFFLKNRSTSYLKSRREVLQTLLRLVGLLADAGYVLQQRLFPLPEA